MDVLEWPTPKVSYSLSLRVKRCQAAVLFDGMELVAPARQHLVRVGLVPDVPDQPVVGCVEHIVEGDGQLDRAQTCGKMPPAGADAVDQELAQLLRQFSQFCSRQAAQVRRGSEGFEQGV